MSRVENYCSLVPAVTLLAASIGRRLRYTNKEIDRTGWLLSNYSAIEGAQELPWPQLQRMLTHEGTPELIALSAAIFGNDHHSLIYCRERLAWPAERLNPPVLLDGGDLIRHGLKPGPDFSTLLEDVRDAQLNGEINSRVEALALVDRLRESPEPLP